MPISKKALVLITVVLMCSVLMAKLSKLISVSVDESDGHLSDYSNRSPSHKPNTRHMVNSNENDVKLDLIINDSPNHLMWFLQVSDLHISVFHDPMRVSNLKELCQSTISAIKPAVVLASGDLTDAKTADNMGSTQYLGEWVLYKNVLDDCRVVEKTVWLDIRGNHDNFNIINQESKENYFRNYSIQGVNHPRSYAYRMKQGGETYSFIAVDACLDPGPRRPFNFIGMLTRSEAAHITQLAEESVRIGSNYTIWFGHYPTSAILAPGADGLRSIIGSHPNSLGYLCGHFHTLGGTVPNMYTLQHAGFLELELGDWKDNRMFRLVAIDHGLMSFVDAKHPDWPLVLVTNPKHALFMMPAQEPLKRMKHSTHIRILVFSNTDIASVKVRVDDSEWRECRHVKGPLYVAKWNPLEYCEGLHNLHVFASDNYGREKTVTQPFSLDGTRLNFPFMARLVLMSNISITFQFLFGIMTCMCVLPLCILRYLHHLTKAQRFRKPRCSIPFFQWWLRKLWILSTVDRIFFPLVLYALYLTVGPWAVGEVIENYTGVIFAWGTIINGQYLPGSFTYAYGFMQMCCFQLPLTLILADTLDQRLNMVVNNTPVGKVARCRRELMFLSIVLMQLTFAYFFWLAYGIMAFLLGPLRTWSAILAGILWYQAVNLPDTSLRNAAAVWYPSVGAPEVLQVQNDTPTNEET